MQTPHPRKDLNILCKLFPLQSDCRRLNLLICFTEFYNIQKCHLGMNGYRVGLDDLFFLLNLLFILIFSNFLPVILSTFINLIKVERMTGSKLCSIRTVTNNSMQTVLYRDEQVYTTLYRWVGDSDTLR